MFTGTCNVFIKWILFLYCVFNWTQRAEYVWCMLINNPLSRKKFSSLKIPWSVVLYTLTSTLKILRKSCKYKIYLFLNIRYQYNAKCNTKQLMHKKFLFYIFRIKFQHISLWELSEIHHMVIHKLTRGFIINTQDFLHVWHKQHHNSHIMPRHYRFIIFPLWNCIMDSYYSLFQAPLLIYKLKMKHIYSILFCFCLSFDGEKKIRTLSHQVNGMHPSLS